MRQFEFEAIHRTRNNVERVRATARTMSIARAHLVNFYGDQFDLGELCCDVNPPHRILGEIDCTSPGAEEFALSLIANGQV
jgi:hypothetical protein